MGLSHVGAGALGCGSTLVPGTPVRIAEEVGPQYITRYLAATTTDCPFRGLFPKPSYLETRSVVVTSTSEYSC